MATMAGFRIDSPQFGRLTSVLVGPRVTEVYGRLIF